MTNKSNTTDDVAAIEAVTHAWEKALAEHDVEGLLACYAQDAVLESPVAAHILGGPGVCRGHDELRPFLTEVVARTPDERQYPNGQQADFVEVMEIDDGLIAAHRVDWGWRGVQILINHEYHRAGGS